MTDEVAKKAPWYTSRTVWAGVLLGAMQIVQVLPIPQVQIIQAILGACATVLGAEKLRDVLGQKQPQQ